MGHGFLGDFVEDDALHADIFRQFFAFLQRFEHVPGDGFPFAIGVSREIEHVSTFDGAGDGGELLFRIGIDFVMHGEIGIGLDGAVLARQIAHMAVGGEHRVIGTEIFVDGFRLGGRFDDDDVATHADSPLFFFVMPVQAGIQTFCLRFARWISAFAGMTKISSLISFPFVMRLSSRGGVLACLRALVQVKPP